MSIKKENKRYVVTYPELIFIVFVFGIILVALYPKDMLKKQILNEKSNYDLSMLYLKNLIKHNPGDESLMLVLANQSLKTGNIDLAIRLLELLHQSKNKKIRQKALLLGYDLEKERYFYIKDKKEQQKEFHKLQNIFINIYYQKLYTQELERWYKEAQFLRMPREEYGLLQELIKQKPNDIKLLKRGYYLATILRKEKDALKYLRKLQKHDKKEQEKWLLEEYYIAMREKNYDRAEKILLSQVANKPKYKNILADFYLYRQKYTQAAKIYLDLYKQTTSKKKKVEYFKKAIQSLIGAKKYHMATTMMKQHEDDFIHNEKMRQFIMKNYVAAGNLDAAAAYANKILQLKYGL